MKNSFILTSLRGNADETFAEENARAHEEWCNHLAAKLLCVSVLAQFGDFVPEQMSFPCLLVTPSLNRAIEFVAFGVVTLIMRSVTSTLLMCTGEHNVVELRTSQETVLSCRHTYADGMVRSTYGC